jgi:tetratricopeptide (TPR) repeat protein
MIVASAETLTPTARPPTAVRRMRALAVVWFWCRIPVLSFIHMPWWGRALVVVGIAAAVLGGGLAVRRELHARNTRRAAVVWDRVADQVVRQDREGLCRSLENIRLLTPDDRLLAKWDEALRTGKADSSDPGMVRFIMIENLRSDRLEGAVREAAVRVGTTPNDWQSRCILAHDALSKGEPEEARKHLGFLPSPFDLAQTIGPGPILFAMTLKRQLGVPAPELMDYLINRLLPALRSEDRQLIPVTERRQLLEGYVYAFDAFDANPDLSSYWVPAGQLGRLVLNDPVVPVEELIRLGQVFEAQLPLLRRLRDRKQFSPEEAERFQRELDERIRETWAKVNARDPKAADAYVGIARGFARAGKPADAEAIIKTGMGACGEQVELIKALVLLRRSTDPNGALALIVKAARDRPPDVTLYQLLAETATLARRRDLILQACEDALAVQPDLPWARPLQARTLLEVGKPAEAVEALTPIRDTCATDVGLTELYVQAAAKAGAFDKLNEYFQRVLAGRQPALPLAGGTAALLNAHRPDLALPWAEKAYSLAPHEPQVHILLADTLRMRAEDGAPNWNLDHVNVALREYQRIYKAHPGNLAVVNNIAWLQLNGLRQPNAAFESAAPLRAKEDNTDLPADFLETLGTIYLERGDLEKAARLLQRAIDIDRTRAGFWTNLARVFLKQDRPGDARGCLDKAARLEKSPREMEEYLQTLRQLKAKTSDLSDGR